MIVDNKNFILYSN